MFEARHIAFGSGRNNETQVGLPCEITSRLYGALCIFYQIPPLIVVIKLS